MKEVEGGEGGGGVCCVWNQTKYIEHVHDEKYIKQFHFMCAFIIWYLFIYSK